EVTFDGRRIRYRYDMAGRGVRIEEGLHRGALAYNLAGELVGRTFPDGGVAGVAHYARGGGIGAGGPGVVCTFDRGGGGGIVREVQAVGPEAQSVSLRYDPDGNLVERETSLGHRMEVQRDALGAAVRAVFEDGEQIITASDVLGREISRQLAGGGRIESAF